MNKALCEHVSAQIVIGRCAMGWSQREFAERIGVCTQQIHKYETGQCYPSVPRLAKIAQTLMISPLFFFESKVDSNQAILLMVPDRWRTELLEAYRKLRPSERKLLTSIAKSLVEAMVPVATARSLERAGQGRASHRAQNSPKQRASAHVPNYAAKGPGIRQGPTP
jgi:transcriptional regulator with XRE-family HTH domain